MKTSSNGLDIIKKYEGLRLTAYQDVVGVWTIGYGHTKNVFSGQKITEQQAHDFLVSDVLSAESDVLNHVVNKGVSLNQNQFDALVSLTFNLGGHYLYVKKFSNGYDKGTTLYNKLLLGDFVSASERFMDFVKAGSKTYQGLINRRKEERELFDSKKKFCSHCGLSL